MNMIRPFLVYGRWVAWALGVGQVLLYIALTTTLGVWTILKIEGLSHPNIRNSKLRAYVLVPSFAAAILCWYLTLGAVARHTGPRIPPAGFINTVTSIAGLLFWRWAGLLASATAYSVTMLAVCIGLNRTSKQRHGAGVASN
jgi:hypothetical protein